MRTTNHSKAYLRCIDSGCLAQYQIDQRVYTCPNCSSLLDVWYEFSLPVAASELKSEFSRRRTARTELEGSGVWRFRELLPFLSDLSHVVTMGEGNTPLYRGERSAGYAGLPMLRFKHQGLNPTGSFKDNGMTTAVSQARVLGADTVVCASTGNTSASMAAYAARAGLKAVVFIPAGQVAYGKLSQSLEYGALVVEVEGSFDDAMRIVGELAEHTNFYLLNSVNPFRLEGQKAIVIELFEQLEWRAPDWIVLPGGNLGNSSAFGKAVYELAQLGLIDRIPRLAVIQAEGAAPFYNLVSSSDRTSLHRVDPPVTLATAIRIGNPVSWRKALRALEWTDGLVERVTEHEIADAKAVIGLDGIGCEPASASTLAGIKRLVQTGVMRPGDNVVAVLTGNLLKDTDYTIDYHAGTLVLKRDPESVSIDGNFPNRPVRVAADRDAILKLLRV